MNRIVVGSGNNIEKILNDKVVINVKEDVNLLINNNKYETYEINVNDANVNVFFIEENVKKTNVLINVNKGFVVLNMVSYNPSDRKIEVNLNECFSDVKRSHCATTRWNSCCCWKRRHPRYHCLGADR